MMSLAALPLSALALPMASAISSAGVFVPPPPGAPCPPPPPVMKRGDALSGAKASGSASQTTTAQTALAEAQGKLTTASEELEKLKNAGGDGDAAGIKKQLSELQEKYKTDIAERDAKLADRDYSDAITRAISGRALKFSSKAGSSVSPNAKRSSFFIQSFPGGRFRLPPCRPT